MTRSYSSRCFRVFKAINGCYLIEIVGFNLSNVDLSDLVLGCPTVNELCPTCLCKLVKSTLSESNNPRVPTPAPARYKAKGHPIPPAPIIAILKLLILNCPSYPSYFNNICLEYLIRDGPNNSGFRLVSRGPEINYL